jgi:light-regulated signal transduction histidine kinase (bacteriophytochrome)
MVLRDNTERKEIEEKLRAHQRDLRVANDALTRANADLKQFAMAASHDLQEPLRTVCAYSQLLIEASREGRQREAERAVQFITDGTDRMGQLLKDLLSYTELNAVEEEEVGNLVDLNRVADKAIENLGTAIERSAANVTRDSLPAVRGWEGHFIQLFQNLIDNALKYRNDQPPRVHLSAQLDGNDWRITISDNGMGIEEKFHKQIFGVFKRLHGKNIPGTGIGLAICQRVVERAGGRIWVESEANQGAFFHFTLPSVPEDGRG